MGSTRAESGTCLARTAGLELVGGLAGLVLGLTQWLMLRRQVTESHRWILGSTLGLGLGLAAGAIVADLLLGTVGHPLWFGALLLVAGTVAGGFTAASVVRFAAMSRTRG